MSPLSNPWFNSFLLSGFLCSLGITIPQVTLAQAQSIPIAQTTIIFSDDGHLYHLDRRRHHPWHHPHYSIRRRAASIVERDLLTATFNLRSAINPDISLGPFLSATERQILQQNALEVERLGLVTGCGNVEVRSRQIARDTAQSQLVNRVWMQDTLRNLDEAAKTCIRR